MSDTYAAEIAIWPFPEKADYDVARELQDAFAEAGIARGIELLLEGRGETDTADGSLYVFDRDDTFTLRVDEQRGRVLSVELPQALNGTMQLTETELPRILRERSIAYVIADDGHYEWAGEEYSWSPGMPRERVRDRLKSGEDALSASSFEALQAKAMTARGRVDLVKLAELVVDNFEYDPHSWYPGRPDPQEIDLPVVEVMPGTRARPSSLAGL